MKIRCGLVLMTLLLLGAAPAGGGEESPAQSPGESANRLTGQAAPPPRIFGVEPEATPSTLTRELERHGYVLEALTLEPPFTARTYRARDEATASFDRVEVLVCNRPAKTVRIRVHGRDGRFFYAKVRERFGMGAAQRADDDFLSARYGKYVARFTGAVTATLNLDDGEPLLTVEMAENERV